MALGSSRTRDITTGLRGWMPKDRGLNNHGSREPSSLVRYLPIKLKYSFLKIVQVVLNAIGVGPKLNVCVSWPWKGFLCLTLMFFLLWLLELTSSLVTNEMTEQARQIDLQDVTIFTFVVDFFRKRNDQSVFSELLHKPTTVFITIIWHGRNKLNQVHLNESFWLDDYAWKAALIIQHILGETPVCMAFNGIGLVLVLRSFDAKSAPRVFRKPLELESPNFTGHPHRHCL